MLISFPLNRNIHKCWDECKPMDITLNYLSVKLLCIMLSTAKHAHTLQFLCWDETNYTRINIFNVHIRWTFGIIDRSEQTKIDQMLCTTMMRVWEIRHRIVDRRMYLCVLLLWIVFGFRSILAGHIYCDIVMRLSVFSNTCVVINKQPENTNSTYIMCVCTPINIIIIILSAIVSVPVCNNLDIARTHIYIIRLYYTLI